MLLLLQLLGGALLVTERTFFPLFASAAGMKTVLISGVSGGRQIAGMVAAVVGGYFADRVGRKWTYFIGNTGFLVAGLLFLLDSHLAIAALWTVSGFLVGICTLGGQSYLVEASSRTRIGTTSALFTWGTTLGGGVGTLGFGVLLDRAGYLPFAWSLVLGSVVVLILNAFALPPVGGAKLGPSRRFGGYGAIVTDPQVILLTALRLIPTFYWGMAVILVPLLLVDRGASTFYVAAFGTVSQIVASVAQIATGRSADRFGAKAPSIVVLSILVVGIVGTAAFSGSMVMVFVMSTIAAAAAWSMSALVPMLVASTTRREEHARTLGWIHLWWNIGMVAGAWVGGALYEIAPWIPFAVAGGVGMLSPILATRLGPGEGRVTSDRGSG